jgi:hypothetical protein
VSDVELKVRCAGRAIRVVVRHDAGSPIIDARFQYLTDGTMKSFDFLCRKTTTDSGGMDTSSKESFIGVHIPHPS